MSMNEFIKVSDFKIEKHVPQIELPNSVKAGEVFLVKISVGEVEGQGHPNTTEHFISNFSLYFKADGDKFAHQLGSADFIAHGESTEGANQGPAYTNPHAIFSVKLNKPGTLTAMSYCNIHGLWESSAKVSL